MTESTEPGRVNPLTDEQVDRPLADDVPNGEDVSAAQEAEDLDQDPDTVPNRLQEAQPPTPERVGPWDDEGLED